VIEGAMTLLVEGKQPLALKAGDIVEKGKPLASPAAAVIAARFNDCPLRAAEPSSSTRTARRLRHRLGS
jgi:hypothetical protein